MSERLPAALEVAALKRLAEGDGGFATVLRKGDPDRGEILLLLLERGVAAALLERRLGADFAYRWVRSDPPADDDADWANRRTAADPDLWLVELDVADAQRFVAEMISAG